MPDTSIAQQIMMSNISMNSQIMQGAFGVLPNISGLNKPTNSTGIANFTVTNSLGKLAYAVEGDSKFDEEIDTNRDGIITYNEYVKSITDSISSKYNIPKSETTYTFGEDPKTGLLQFSVNNMGKIFAAYINNSIQLPTGIIEQEA